MGAGSVNYGQSRPEGATREDFPREMDTALCQLCTCQGRRAWGHRLEGTSGPGEVHYLEGGLRGCGAEGHQGPGVLFGSPYCGFGV